MKSKTQREFEARENFRAMNHVRVFGLIEIWFQLIGKFIRGTFKYIFFVWIPVILVITAIAWGAYWFGWLSMFALLAIALIYMFVKVWDRLMKVRAEVKAIEWARVESEIRLLTDYIYHIEQIETIEEWQGQVNWYNASREVIRRRYSNLFNLYWDKHYFATWFISKGSDLWVPPHKRERYAL